jgi:DNA-binding response OmpR family regulator
MARAAAEKTVQLLCIGRMDDSHQPLWQQLEREGVSVSFARTQRAGVQMAAELQPQVVLISIVEGHSSGERICRLLGRTLPGAQRLLICDRASVTENSCEGRLVRPFTVRKLREVVQELLKFARPHVLSVGPLTLDLTTRVLTTPRGQSRVTPKQAALLQIFLERPNRVISRRDLMERIWNTAYLGDTRTLDVHIRWLRERIEEDPTRPQILLTRRGVGYYLNVEQSCGLDELLDEESAAEPLLLAD